MGINVSIWFLVSFRFPSDFSDRKIGTDHVFMSNGFGLVLYSLSFWFLIKCPAYSLPKSFSLLSFVLSRAFLDEQVS